MGADGVSQLREMHHLVRGRVGAKGVVRQWLEMLALFVLHGNGPGFYQMGGFWRTGERWSSMARHLSYRQFKAQVDALNPPDYQKLSQNKIAEKAILTLLGIPTPRFIGLLQKDHGRDTSGAPLRNADELARLMARDPAPRVCFKLVEGHGGKGFVAADVLRGSELRFRTLTPLGPAGPSVGEGISADDLVTRLGDAPRVIEAYLDQHPAYAAFNPTSVNTLRIWVLRHGTQTSTRLAFLRLGRAGALVDNRSAGGIVVPIDVDTGRMSQGLDGQPRRQVFSVHPDSGVRIEGVVLPRFGEAIALAEQCLTVFPYMNFAGMDVAMTPDGPAIIESNVQPARSGAVHVGIPSRDVFSV